MFGLVSGLSLLWVWVGFGLGLTFVCDRFGLVFGKVLRCVWIGSRFELFKIIKNDMHIELILSTSTFCL